MSSKGILNTAGAGSDSLTPNASSTASTTAKTVATICPEHDKEFIYICSCNRRKPVCPGCFEDYHIGDGHEPIRIDKCVQDHVKELFSCNREWKQRLKSHSDLLKVHDIVQMLKSRTEGIVDKEKEGVS